MIIENDTRDKNAVCYLFVANSIFFLLLASILDIVVYSLLFSKSIFDSYIYIIMYICFNLSISFNLSSNHTFYVIKQKMAVNSLKKAYFA